MKEILSKKVPRNPSHEEREYKSNSKRHTISEFLDVITPLLLPRISIIIKLIIDLRFWSRRIDPKIMLYFQFLHCSELLRCTLTQFYQSIKINIWDDIAFGKIFLKTQFVLLWDLLEILVCQIFRFVDRNVSNSSWQFFRH